MKLAYGLLLKHKTDGYQVKLGMMYEQDNVQRYFVMWPDGSSRLLREDVINQNFEESK